MREIKFRAWDGKRYMYYDLVNWRNFYVDDKVGVAICTREWADNHINPLVFEQYTGFKDREGKKIYEGDIVQSDTTYPLEIIWNDGGWAFKYNNMEDTRIDFIGYGDDDDCEINGDTFKWLKIIGNTHERGEV